MSGRIPHLRVVGSAVGMPIGTATSYISDYMGRNAKALRKPLDITFLYLSRSDRSCLLVGKAGIVDLVPPPNAIRTAAHVMVIATLHAFWMLVRPMIVTVLVFSKPQAVRRVFFCCSPAQIFRAVVQFIPIGMRAMFPVIRARAIEYSADYVVRGLFHVLPGDVKRVNVVAASVRKRREDRPPPPLNPPMVRYEISRGEWYRLPDFKGMCSNSHSADPLRCGQGRALLTQRFRPAFPSRITICSQLTRAGK